VGAEFNGASCECKQGVILAATNIVTWVEVGTALANDDFAGINQLAAETLYAEALCI
jgi:hypothetical protein